MARSRWKNSYVPFLVYNTIVHKKDKLLFSQLQSANSQSIRACVALPFMQGKVFWVENGKASKALHVSTQMLGDRFGEYINTKKICVYRRKKRKNKKKKKANKKKKKAKKKKK